MHLKIIGGSSGRTTKVYLDGKQLERCRAVKYECAARDLAMVTLEIYPESVEIDAEAEASIVEIRAPALAGSEPGPSI